MFALFSLLVYFNLISVITYFRACLRCFKLSLIVLYCSTYLKALNALFYSLFILCFSVVLWFGLCLV